MRRYTVAMCIMLSSVCMMRSNAGAAMILIMDISTENMIPPRRHIFLRMRNITRPKKPIWKAKAQAFMFTLTLPAKT